MGNCLFLRARGWGIDRQMRTKLQIPGGMPGGGMVTGRIEPCIIAIADYESMVIYSYLQSITIKLIIFFLHKALSIVDTVNRCPGYVRGTLGLSYLSTAFLLGGLLVET